jgi:hypothetical protein
MDLYKKLKIDCKYIHNILLDFGGSIFFYKLLRIGKLLEPPTLFKIYRTVDTLLPIGLFIFIYFLLRAFSP